MIKINDDKKILEIINKFSERKKYMENSCSRKYLQYDEMMNNFDIYLNNIPCSNPRNISKKTIIEMNNYFFNNYVKLNDVYYLNGKNIEYGSPFNIKISSKDNDNYGELVMDLGLSDIYIYNKILLSNNYNSNLIGIYAHELVHSQLESELYKYITNYMNQEVISILIEKIIVFELSNKDLENILLMRLNFLKTAFDVYKRNVWGKNSLDPSYTVRSYIESTLKANHLFDIYVNSNTMNREKILKYIESIFNNEITVEQFLKKEKVTFENSKTLKYIK